MFNTGGEGIEGKYKFLHNKSFSPVIKILFLIPKIFKVSFWKFDNGFLETKGIFFKLGNISMKYSLVRFSNVQWKTWSSSLKDK